MSRSWRTLRGFCALVGLLAAAALPAGATITPAGDVSPSLLWSGTTTAYVGNTSAGTLTVNGGSDLLSGYTYIAFGDTVTGLVTVSGAGSTWTNSGSLSVGYSGAGTLNVADGGTVASSSGYIGYNSGSVGAVTVSRAGSTWNNSDGLLVGYWGGVGTLNVANGGAVNSSYAFIGWALGSAGSVTVSGAGSTWTNGSSLYVGDVGAGTLEITNGGAVNSGGGDIGYGSGSLGSVTVSGAGSTWTSNWLSLGFGGTGTLSVANGGSVSVLDTAYVYVGGVTGSSRGTVVFGSGGGTLTSLSLYTAISSLTGAGVINTRGLVSNANLVFNGAGSTTVAFGTAGTMTVDLSASDGNGDLGAGFEGNGALTVQNGAKIYSNYGYIGYMPGLSGAATVTGSGSTWTVNYGLAVGSWLGVASAGTGTLTIANGGAVSSSYAYIGYDPASVGSVTVSGAGSTWTQDLLYVGGSGSGMLRVVGGADVSSSLSYVGQLVGSRGSVTVDGAGSTWTNGTLYVGSAGTGTLSVANGGFVSSVNAYLGDNAGSAGAVTVSGAGSIWTNSSAVEIGSSGTTGAGSGTLTISNSGRVVATALNGGAGAMTVNFDGGILQTYSASNVAWIMPGAGAANVYIQGGGATLDTNNYTLGGGCAMGISVPLQHDPALGAGLDGGLTKVGLGTLTLSGVNTYNGLTRVAAGALELVDASGAGAFAPVLARGGASLGHGLLVFDYTAAGTDPWAVVHGLLGKRITSFNTNPADVWVCLDRIADHKVIVANTLPGDANLDFIVNGADLNTVLSNYNRTGMTWQLGDFDNDGNVNGADLNAVLSNYNQTAGLSAAVPEPSTLALLGLGAVGLFGGVRRWPRRRA
jgi:fibronectin-binding autotransporter adhesin